MQIDSPKQEAVALANWTVAGISDFRTDQRRDGIFAARMKLDSAQKKDPEHLPFYYDRVIANDLNGKAKDALGAFEKVPGEKPSP